MHCNVQEFLKLSSRVNLMKHNFCLDIKSKYDEERSLREAAEQKVSHLTEELNKESAIIQDLKTELVIYKPFIRMYFIIF